MNYSIKGEWLNITIDDSFCFDRLSDFFSAYHIGKKKANQYLLDEDICINHEPINNINYVFEKGTILRIRAFKKMEIDYIPENLFPLDVIYEDAFCMVVSKPAGYIIHDDHNSLANVISYYYKTHKIKTPVRYIHRLDKETSGLVFICKCPFFQPYYDYLLLQKLIEREYKAYLSKPFLYDRLDVEAPIGKDRHENNRYGVYKTGKYARTLFTKIDEKTVLCKLYTGRTHQIRVHLAYLDCPIKNDAIYGTIEDEGPMGLVAYKLSWLHPLTNQKQTVEI